MEAIVERMQDPHSGVVVRTVKSFMSKIPSVFTGQTHAHTHAPFSQNDFCYYYYIIIILYILHSHSSSSISYNEY